MRTPAAISILLHLALMVSIAATEDLDCRTWTGSYRDCTCGLMYRESEERCCNAQTCFQPNLKVENLTCSFRCENGGKFDRRLRVCDCQDGYYGLCCEKETWRCGGNFFAPRGNFTSPGFPDKYPNRTRCVWKIATDPQRQIALGTVDNQFEVEQGSNVYSCNHDWISVYDGDSKDGRRIGSYCGNGMRTFQTVQSTSRFLYIEFETDWQQQRKGFHLQYVTYFAFEPCGTAVFGLPTGVINSPHYPLNYGPNRHCTYEIRVKRRHNLILTTLDMNMPATADCSRGDRVLVSRGNIKRQVHLTVFCGQNLFSPYIVRGARQVILDFTSDYIRDGRFQIQYQQVPT